MRRERRLIVIERYKFLNAHALGLESSFLINRSDRRIHVRKKAVEFHDHYITKKNGGGIMMVHQL